MILQHIGVQLQAGGARIAIGRELAQKRREIERPMLRKPMLAAIAGVQQCRLTTHPATDVVGMFRDPHPSLTLPYCQLPLRTARDLGRATEPAQPDVRRRQADAGPAERRRHMHDERLGPT